MLFLVHCHRFHVVGRNQNKDSKHWNYIHQVVFYVRFNNFTRWWYVNVLCMACFNSPKWTKKKKKKYNFKRLKLYFFFFFSVVFFSVVFMGVHIKQRQSSRTWVKHMQKKLYMNVIFYRCHLCCKTFLKPSGGSQRLSLDSPKIFQNVLCFNVARP